MKTKSNTFGTTININKTFVQDFRSRVETLLNARQGEWQGTMTQLSYALTRAIKRSRPSYWPTSPSVMRRVVNTVVPTLRNSGVSVAFRRGADRVRSRIVSFSK
jgi:hypothetical protein